MSGIDYLLDTNFILGLLKSTPEATALVADVRMNVRQCGYSAVTRMELLGFPGLNRAEESLIRHKLAMLTYLPINIAVEDVAIQLRRAHKIKLPDAIIAATTLTFGATLLTFDRSLKKIVDKEMSRETSES